MFKCERQKYESQPVEEMMDQELNVVIMPNGSLQLEWTDAQNATNKDSRLLQDEIYKMNNRMAYLFTRATLNLARNSLFQKNGAKYPKR